MKNGKLMIAAFAVLVAGAVSAKAEGGTIDNLSGAADKISSMDMDKNLNEAGNALSGFYSGSKAKADSETSVVYAAQGAEQAPRQAEKDICNAKPSKIAKLGAEVKPLAASSVQAAAAKTRGAGGSSWVDDFNTVVDYVTNVGGAATDVVDDVTCGPNGSCTEDNNPFELPGHLHDLNDALNCTD